MIRKTHDPGNSGAASHGVIGSASLKLFMVPLFVWMAGAGIVLSIWVFGASEDLVVSLLAVGFVCLTASLVGQAPVAALGRDAADQLPVAMLASIVFRGGCTLLGVLSLVKLELISGPTAAIGCGLWYALMLAADVWAVSRHVAIAFPGADQASEGA